MIIATKSIFNVVLITRDAEIGEHITKHGDGAKDIAFEVEELDAIFKVCKCQFYMQRTRMVQVRHSEDSPVQFYYSIKINDKGPKPLTCHNKNIKSQINVYSL